MPSFDFIQFQDAGHIVEKGRGDLDGTTLFQPCIPSDAYACERGDFLAAKPRRSPPLLVDRYLRPLVLGSLVLMALCLTGVGLFGANASVGVVGVLLVGWRIGVAAVFVGFQTWILRTAGDAALPASAIYVAIFNAAIGAGALLGAVVISFTDLAGLLVIAALALVASLVPVILLSASAITTTAAE